MQAAIGSEEHHLKLQGELREAELNDPSWNFFQEDGHAIFNSLNDQDPGSVSSATLYNATSPCMCCSVTELGAQVQSVCTELAFCQVHCSAERGV